MDISNWSKEYQTLLKREARQFERYGAKELAMRISVALFAQDSCGNCATETIKMILLTGKDGLWTCPRCTKELEKV